MISDQALARLRQATEVKVSSKLAEYRRTSARLRELADHWDQAAQAAAEAEVVAELTGSEPDPDAVASLDSVADLIRDLADGLDPDKPVPESKPEEPAPSFPPLPPAPPPPPPPKLRTIPPPQATIPIPTQPSREVAAAAASLIDGVGALVANGEPSQIRAMHLIQAFAAETRALQSQVHEDLELHRRLDDLIPALARLKEQMEVGPFIKGLRRDWRTYSQAEWARLASKSRMAVEQFDRDVQKSPFAAELAKVKIPPRKAVQASAEATSSQFPKLHRMSKTKSVILVAGDRLPANRSRNVLERFGFEPEIEHANRTGAPRAAESIVRRIRGGSVGAVVIVDGFISHTLSSMVKNTCESAKVPFAYGGTGGIGALERAFGQIEDVL